MIIETALLLLAAAGATAPTFDACTYLPVEKVDEIVGGSFKASSKFDEDSGTGRCSYRPATPSTFGGLDQDAVDIRVLTDATIAPTKYLNYHNTQEKMAHLLKDPTGAKPVSGVGDQAVDVAGSVSAGRWILKGTTLFNVSYRAPVTSEKIASTEQHDAIVRKLEQAILSGLH